MRLCSTCTCNISVSELLPADHSQCTAPQALEPLQTHLTVFAPAHCVLVLLCLSRHSLLQHMSSSFCFTCTLFLILRCMLKIALHVNATHSSRFFMPNHALPFNCKVGADMLGTIWTSHLNAACWCHSIGWNRNRDAMKTGENFTFDTSVLPSKTMAVSS